MKNRNTFEELREQNKMGLQTYFMNLGNNHFERAINKLTIDMENELMKIIKGKSDDEFEHYFLEKELFSISEMKIIYAFKHFEFHLKFLLRASYTKIKVNKFYKWEFIEEFLKTKGIRIKEIKSYKEINELRIINNSIKHSNNIINESSKNIKEFRNKEILSYKDLNLFYERVEDSIVSFISSLSILIEKDIYKFDEKRLDEFTENLAKRMDRKTMNKFISKLEKIE